MRYFSLFFKLRGVNIRPMSKKIKFSHLIQDYVNENGVTTRQLGRTMGLTFWSARTLRWGDRMHISDRLLERCIEKLDLPPRTARMLAQKQNRFSRQVLNRLRSA
jgi:hypothetical protein